MNRFVIAVVVILVVAAGVYLYTSQQNPQQPPSANTPAAQQSTSDEENAQPATTTETAETNETANTENTTPSSAPTEGEKTPTAEASSTTSTPQSPATETQTPAATTESASTPAVPARVGEIPPNAKVIGENYGLVHTGIPGGKIVVAGVTGPKTLNDLVGQETTTTNITGRLLAGLVEVNPSTFEIEPALASHWEFSEDKLSIVFHLREGLKFSDGQPFTSEDVVFFFNDLVYNPDVNNSYRDILEVDGEPLRFEALDEYTVKVTMAKPFRPVLRTLGGNILPKHLLADKVAKLNPGVNGVSTYIQQVIDGSREQLEAIGVDAVEATDWALKDLQGAIDSQDIEKASTAATAIQANLQTLMDSLTEEDQELKDKLESAIGQAQNVGAYTKAGQWQGVAVGTFNRSWTTTTPADQIAGLGPFKFVRYDVDQQVILERNPYYWKVDENGVQLPYVDQLIVLYVQNVETAVLKFRSGELDTRGIRSEDWPVFIEAFDAANDCQQSGIRVVCANPDVDYQMMRAGPDFGTLFYTLNQDSQNLALRAVFRDIKYRQAMAHAVDKQSIINNVYNGLALEQWSPVSMPSPYYDADSVVTFPYDLEAAGQLLDELGLVDLNGDGIRNIPDAFLEQAGVDPSILDESIQDENNRELEYQLQTYTGSNVIEEVANLMISDLKKIGVNVTLRLLDFNTLVTNIFGGSFDALMVGFTGGVEPYNGANLWTTEGNLHFWRPSAKENPPEWEQRVDELFDLAASTFDENEVKQYYAEFQKLASENLPLIYTVNNEFLYVYRSVLRNTDNFQAITGNVPTVFAFSEVLWLDDEQRRSEIDVVDPQ